MTIADAREEARIAEEEAAAAAVLAATKAAGTKGTAIGVEALQATAEDAGIGGTGATIGTAEGNYQLSIKRDRMATTVKVIVNGATDDDDEEFNLAMDLGGGRTMRTMHTRAMDADSDGNVMTEVVIVATDIEAPKATAFGMVAGQELDVSTDTTNDSPDTTDEALAVVQNLATYMLVQSSAFAAGTGSSVTHTFNAAVVDDDQTAVVDESMDAAAVAGTYNGAMGMYRCNGGAGADCTVVVDDEGMLTAMSAGWVFIPAMGATSDVPDADYLNYGFWLKRRRRRRP